VRPTAEHGPADLEELRDARATERLGPYLRELWSRRAYALYVAGAEVRGRQINSVLGNLWHLINPALQIGIFYLIFGLVLDTTRGVDNFIGYLSVGIFTFSYTQRAVVAGGKSLGKYKGLIQIVTFPRTLLPLTTTLTEAIAILPAFVVMFGVAFASGETPSLAWLGVIPLFAVQTVFNTGAAMLTARAVNHVADVQQVLPFMFRLLFYASGVLFNVSAYVDEGSKRLLFELNPLYCMIETYRSLLLDYRPAEPHLVRNFVVWSVAIVLIGFTWFRAGEDRYGEL
jgi:teichoic acid transport system permease protein